jgi:hypothetical protein
MRIAGVTLDAATVQLLVCKGVDDEIVRTLTKDDVVELGITDFAAQRKVTLLVAAAQRRRNRHDDDNDENEFICSSTPPV